MLIIVRANHEVGKREHFHFGKSNLIEIEHLIWHYPLVQPDPHHQNCDSQLHSIHFPFWNKIWKLKFFQIDITYVISRAKRRRQGSKPALRPPYRLRELPTPLSAAPPADWTFTSKLKTLKMALNPWKPRYKGTYIEPSNNGLGNCTWSTREAMKGFPAYTVNWELK